MQLKIEVPEQYPQITLTCLLICLECVLTAFCIVSPARYKYFNKEFMKKFEKVHKENFPDQDIPELGLPDNGSGRFAQELDYPSWFNFNNAWRTQQNFVEQIPMVIMTIMACGLLYPKASLIVGWLYVVGRLLYIIGYLSKGPDFRFFGVAISTAIIYASLFVAVGTFGYDCLTA